MQQHWSLWLQNLTSICKLFQDVSVQARWSTLPLGNTGALTQVQLMPQTRPFRPLSRSWSLAVQRIKKNSFILEKDTLTDNKIMYILLRKHCLQFISSHLSSQISWNVYRPPDWVYLPEQQTLLKPPSPLFTKVPLPNT